MLGTVEAYVNDRRWLTCAITRIELARGGFDIHTRSAKPEWIPRKVDVLHSYVQVRLASGALAFACDAPLTLPLEGIGRGDHVTWSPFNIHLTALSH